MAALDRVFLPQPGDELGADGPCVHEWGHRQLGQHREPLACLNCRVPWPGVALPEPAELQRAGRVPDWRQT